MHSMNQATIIAFGNQKGGTGKSTLCRILATQLWYSRPDIRTVIWDCDNPQFTNARLREMDLVLFDALPDLNRYRKIKGEYSAQCAVAPLYPIKEMDISRIEREGEADLAQFDLVFIDLPGKIDSEELGKVLPAIDYLFIPIDYDYGTVDSTVRYLTFLLSLAGHHELPLSDNIYLFFNKMEKNQIAGSAIPVRQDILETRPGVKFLEQVVLSRKNIKDDTFSTLCRLHQDSKTDNEHFQLFFREFLDTIHPQVEKLNK